MIKVGTIQCLSIFFALIFSTTSEGCHLWTYNSNKNGKDKGYKNYSSHCCEQQYMENEKRAVTILQGAGRALGKTHRLP